MSSIISLLVPTRNRPDGLLEMVRSAITMADDPDNVEVIAITDLDDNSYDAVSHPNMTIHSVERTVLSNYWNIAYCYSKGEIFMHAGDDIRFRTSGWDTIVRRHFDAVPDKILFLYGRDGIQDEALGTHGFIHQKWVDAVGYFVPPYFSSDYNDTWLNEVAESIGRRVYEPEIYTEHMHPSAGKGELDKTHQERLERHERDNVDGLYQSLAQQRILDSEKLRRVMQ